MASLAGAMVERHVVSCFLLRRDAGEDRVLLACRSERVGSYQGRWAAISGYVDTTPAAQALVEIAEETGLPPDAVRLLRAGEPLTVDDAALGCRWIVHPFLFEVASPEAIRLDWEHTEARWVAPGDVAALATVPRLADALAAVYPPLDPPAGTGGSTQRP
jgi:8-oxo-dGTP pyrophosphatase MutT (NUDIX family)